MDDSELDMQIIAQMPYFIAVNCRKLRDTLDPAERVRRIIYLYTLILRTLAIIFISQYLIRDRERVRDPGLNEVLLNSLPTLTLDEWLPILFKSLMAYEGKRDLLFMPELYDMFWDTSAGIHRERTTLKKAFDRLIQAYFEAEHSKNQPQTSGEWESLSTELWGHLRQILSHIVFLTRYDFVRMLKCDQNICTYELHRGQAITVVREAVLQPDEYVRGWFYLLSPTGGSLLLHPLFVLWNRDEATDHRNDLDAGDRLPSEDVGIYNRLVSERLQYLLSTFEQQVMDQRNVQAFLALLNIIDERKRTHEESERLTWWQVRETCHDISELRMATVSLKYQQDTHQPRAKAHEELLAFLDSNKRAFVLIGKSGVGKSNFLLALRDELREARNDTCLLMYDGAQLSTQSSLTQIVTRDFANRLTIAGHRIEDVWQTIAQVEGIGSRRVVLCVDAVNENAEARSLLRQLDELVQTPWPWLKVVFTSRPETWKSIKRGLRLSEALYYHAADSSAVEVQLEPFGYSEQLEPFTRQELPEAYARYQAKYVLRTRYEDIPAHIRDLLREPLNLWLIASTYHGEEIPATASASDLIERYVTALCVSSRLRDDDLRLLERFLVPLMTQPDHYTNAISSGDLDQAGNGLYEAIFSEQRLSDGRLVNESFLNLVNAEILVVQEGRREKRIAFKYEQFYEYFVGRRLYGLSLQENDQHAFFLRAIASVDITPFLWGAVRSALTSHLLAGSSDLVIALCFTDQQRVKEMMVDVLTSYGRDHQSEAKQLLSNLLPPIKPLSSVGRIRQLMRKPSAQVGMRMRNAGKTAVEAASHLGIAEVLRIGALQEDPAIRVWTVLHLYQFWKGNQEGGFAILDDLAQAITLHRIPNIAAFESTLGVSALIFFDHVHSPHVLHRLQGIWQVIGGRILGIHQHGARLVSAIRAFMRERIFAIALAAAFRMISELPETGALTRERLDSFYHLSSADKALYTRLVMYLDRDTDYSIETMLRDFRDASHIRDMLVESVGMLGMSARLAYDPQGFFPHLQSLIDEYKASPTATIWLANAAYAITTVLDRDPTVDSMFESYVDAIATCQQYYSKPEWKATLRTFESPEAMHLGQYVYYQFLRAGTVQTAWLESRIDGALQRNDVRFFQSLLTSHLQLVGVELAKPQAALDTLAIFFSHRTPEIEPLIGTFLARLRVHYPDDVEGFLDEQEAPGEFRLHVQTSEPTETVGQLIGLRSYRFFRDEMIIESPEFRAKVMAFLTKATEYHNTQSWAGYLIREVINVVFGEQVLRHAD